MHITDSSAAAAIAPTPAKPQAGKSYNFTTRGNGDAQTRTASTIQNWTPVSGQQETLARFEDIHKSQSFDSALAYAPQNEDIASQQAQPSKQDDDNYTFWDVLDIVNPLQHIPIVGTIYRELSDDEIKPASRIIGGGLFGGPIGATVSTANVIIEHETGRDVSGNAMALIYGDENVPRQVHIEPDFSKIETERIYNFNRATNAYQQRYDYNS